MVENDKHQLKGIISTRLLVKKLKEGWDESLLVKDLMESNLVTVTPKTSTSEAIKIMVEKNYTFVGTNNFRNNAFFISNQYINQIKIRKPNIKNLSEFTDAKYNENRNKLGNLTYLHEKLSIIKDCEVINLKNNKLTKISKII